MTIIAYRDGIMASDSISVSAWTILSLKRKKLYRMKDGSVIGICGTTAILEAYRDWLQNDRAGPRPTLHGQIDAKETASHVLAALPDGRLELHTSNGIDAVGGDDGFYAIGCGADLALGAMEFGATAEAAVAVAIRRSMGCGGAIQIEHVKAPAQPFQEFDPAPTF